MSDGFITLDCSVTLSFEHYGRISQCAKDLNLPFDDVLRAVINTSVRRQFDGSSVQEVPGDE